MAYEWAVIGAGPAGIAAIGKLLDFGVSENNIVWIDPAFQVGDFGTHWRNVSSNTKVKLFLQFLKSSPAFQYANHQQNFELDQVNPEETCFLRLMTEPLQWITDHFLSRKISSIRGFADTLFLQNKYWHIEFANSQVQSKNIILAIGSEPKKLQCAQMPIIPLMFAMDDTQIKNYISAQDTIAVFGSSHSAILVLRHLVEAKVKRIINFYRSPLRYAVYFDDWTLFDDTGLKGSTASWARQYIDGSLPLNLERIYSDADNIKSYLPHCDKLVYAIGFERRKKPDIRGIEEINSVLQNGIIAPGLFGLGIAFPEPKINPLGMLEHRVGLW